MVEVLRSKLDFILRPKVSLGLIVLLLQIFLFVNSSLVYGAAAEVIRDSLVVYILMQAFIFAAFDKKLPTVSLSAGSVRLFFMSFAIAGLFFLLLPVVILGGIEDIIVGLGFGIFHAFVIAYTEEVIFRWVLPIQLKLGDLWSNVLFGLFHLAVYNANIVAVLFAIVLGFVFSAIRARFGLMSSIGVHTAYNFKALKLI